MVETLVPLWTYSNGEPPIRKFDLTTHHQPSLVNLRMEKNIPQVSSDMDIEQFTT